MISNVGVATNSEVAASFRVPAHASNRFSVASGDLVRVAFAECAPGQPLAENFHSAVVMTPGDARALAELLLRVLEQAGGVVRGH